MAEASIQDLLRAMLQSGSSGASSDAVRQLNTLLNKGAVGDTTEGVVYSAFPMDDAQLESLKPKLESRFKSKLQLRVVQDSSLIGGIRVVVGDNVLDASVKNSIEKMRNALSA